MYSREERTRLTGEIYHMSASIPGAERYFRRSLHVKNWWCWGCPLIRACSVVRCNTVYIYIYIYMCVSTAVRINPKSAFPFRATSVQSPFYFMFPISD